jgi:hypothetical protein
VIFASPRRAKVARNLSTGRPLSVPIRNEGRRHGKGHQGKTHHEHGGAQAPDGRDKQAFACARANQASGRTEAEQGRSQARGAQDDAGDTGMRLRTFIAHAFAVFIGCAGAPAQDRPPTAVDPRACAPDERLPPPRENDPATTGRGENLSDKLARTDGVICPPPNVDPEIRAPTPDAGRTPVIPPPGSPGGDPTVRPK